jgi:hypothetical protein
MRDTPAGPVAVDQVPTSLCWWGDRLLVANLTAGPFPRGEATVKSFDPQTRNLQTIADGFTAMTDLACSRSATGGLTLVISELTNDLSAPMSTGRVVVYEGGTPRVVVSGVAATAVAIHPMTGDIYTTLLFSGRLLRVPMR